MRAAVAAVILPIAATAGWCGLPLLAADTWASTALAIVVVASMATWACLLAYGPRPEAPASVGHLPSCSGNHLLLPAVSPGKPREGLAIGAVVGIAAAIATQRWFHAITCDDAIMVCSSRTAACSIGSMRCCSMPSVCWDT